MKSYFQLTRNYRKECITPYPQQKPGILDPKETSYPLTEGVVVLVSGRADKWLPMGPIDIPGDMLAIGSLRFTSKNLKEDYSRLESE